MIDADDATPVRFVRPDLSGIDGCTTPCRITLPTGALLLSVGDEFDGAHAMRTTVVPGERTLRVRERPNTAHVGGRFLVFASVLTFLASVVCFGAGAEASSGTSLVPGPDAAGAFYGAGASFLALGFAGVAVGVALLNVDTSPRIEVIADGSRSARPWLGFANGASVGIGSSS